MDFSALNGLSPKLVSIGIANAKNALHQGEHYGVRTTKEYELDLIIGGEGVIRTDEITDTLEYGMLFFRHPDMIVDGWGGYHCYHIHFTFEGDNCHSKFPLPYKVKLRNMEIALRECALLYEEFINGKPELDFIASKCLSVLLYELYKESRDTAVLYNENKLSEAMLERINGVISLLEKHPQHKYSLEQLCEMTNVSKYFFCHSFKAVTGESVIVYQNRRRIRLAQKKLLETDCSIKEIMFDCGFENSAQFFQLFKRYTGKTPQSYRNDFSMRWNYNID